MTELAGRGIAGISAIRAYSFLEKSATKWTMQWPIVKLNGTCGSANTWRSLRAGCGAIKDTAVCAAICANIGMVISPTWELPCESAHRDGYGVPVLLAAKCAAWNDTSGDRARSATSALS